MHLIFFLIFEGFHNKVGVKHQSIKVKSSHSFFYVYNYEKPNVFICKLLVYGVKCHFQQYFSYIVVVSFIGGENWRLEYHMKTTDLSQVFDKLYHIMLYCIEYTSPWTYWIKIYSTLLLSGRCHHTCLPLPHCCSCLKPRPRFPMPCVMVLPVFSCFEVRGGCSIQSRSILQINAVLLIRSGLRNK
jgi:hypothetical protein